MERYVAYMRVSTERQGRSGLGLAVQRDVIRQFVENRGVVVAEFIEVESGRKDNRDVLWKAISEARREKARLLIARLDRFSRRVSFIAKAMEENVGLTVAEMPSATDFQLHIFAALAQEERRLISLRTKAALQQAKAQGKTLGRNGRALADRRKGEADEYAIAVREALGDRLGAWSYSALARYLTEQGFPTRSGQRWRAQTVRSYLSRLDRLSAEGYAPSPR